MTFGQVRDATLKLLNQYSIGGSVVSSTYNNQQDYLNRIPGLVNDAMMEIATTSRKIPMVLNLTSLACEDLGKEYRFTLPADFYQFKSGDTVVTEDGRILHTSLFSMQGNKFLIVPKEEAVNCTITYYRYPAMLPDTPSDNLQLDNVPETHYAIPFYVASFLASSESEFHCSLFYNKYEDKLAKMSAGITAEIHPINEEYAFGSFDCLS